MKSAILGTWIFFLLVTIAFAQWGGGYGTAPGGGGGSITGGTGCNTSGTSLLKGSGTGGCANAVAGTDYAIPPSGSAVLKGNGAGGFNSAVAGTDYAPPTSGTAILKGNGTGGSSSAVSGTDYAPPTSGTSLLKGNNIGGFAAAVAGADYPPVPTLSCGQDSTHACGYNTTTNSWTNPAMITIPAGPPGAVQWNNAGNLAGTAVTGLVKGNGASAPSAAAAGTDYAAPPPGSAILKGNGAGGFSSATSGTDYAPATSGSSVLKGNGAGGTSAAVAGTDYAPITSGTSILKGNGAGGFSSAAAGTDYAPATTGAANLPLFTNGTGGYTNGTVSGNTTEVTSFSGPATPARCIHTDASGNAAVTATDCTAGTGGIPGYLNTPAVTASGGNSTVTLQAQCSLPNCTDFNTVANGANAGTLTISPPASTGLTTGQFVWVYVKDTGTAPTDVLFGTVSGVTYQSYVLGLQAADLTSTAAGESAKRATVCGQPLAGTSGAPQVLAYQFWWDGTNLSLTGCGGNSPSSTLSVALGGTQCGAAGPMATTLPASPIEGTICSVTNAGSCVAGTPLNTAVIGTTHCQVIYQNGAWQPAGGAIAPTTGGFTAAGTGLSASGSTISLTTPVAAANGGAGTVTGVLKANGAGMVSAAVSNTDYQAPIPSLAPAASTWLTGFTAPSTFTTKRPASTDLSDLPIPPSSGGDGCAQTPGLTYNTLPASPTFGSSCFITDCKTGIAGTPETGGGTTPCAVAYLGSSAGWVDGGIAAATSNSGNGVTIQVANDSTSPPVQNELASVSTSNTAIITPVGAQSGIQGVCIANCKGSGATATNATIQTQGSVLCTFVGGVTAGDYAEVAQTTGNAGKCQDAGTSPSAGVTLVGTIIAPTTASAGTYNVNLFGPDVIAAAGTSNINAGLVGNPGVYSASKAISPVPGVFHISTSGTDQIFKILTSPTGCLNSSLQPVACDIIVDPGVQDTETGPDLLGYSNCGGQCPAHQTLIIDNGKVIFSEVETPTPRWPQDDGLVLAPNSSLYCMGHGSNTAAGISTKDQTTSLNSLVTTLGGIILNKWISGNTQIRGEFVYDSGSNAVWRVLSCGTSGTCTTGTTNPFPASPTRFATVTDGSGSTQVTWQAIQTGSRFVLSSGYVDVSGCWMNVNQLAKVNNTFRISGVTGGLGAARNIWPQGIGNGTGSDDQTGSDAFLIDGSQANGFCLAAGSPLACCLGLHSGSCDSNSPQQGSSLISIQAVEPGPNGGAVGVNAGYITRITGGGVGLISIDGGQMGDLQGNGNQAGNLTAELSIDSAAHQISFNNFYFETSGGPGNYRPPDAILLSNARGISFTDTIIGGSGGTGGPAGGNVVNSLHIVSGGGQSQNIFFRGSIGGTGTATTYAIKNEQSGYLLPSGSGGQTTYDFDTASSNYLFDRVVTFLQPAEFGQNNLSFSAGTYSNCGTCNATTYGTLCAVSDITGCSQGGTITGGGGHRGLAYCNQTSASTYAWSQVVCN